DFRSADGLYNLVKKQYPKTVLKGKDLFDANLFRDNTTTAVFYTFISELHAQTLKAKPSPTHHFIKMLSERGKLLRCYTQNIDCLEEELGMETSLVCEKGKVKKDVNVVQLHGSLRKLKCTICSEPYGFLTDYEKVFREGEAPDCPKCELNDVIRVAQGKRKIATGTLRPDIVLYNENHPFGDAIGRIQISDLQKSPDVLLVMGTSLKVHGLRLLVRKVAKTVHENKKGCVILVNKTPVVGKEWTGVFDYFIEGECDRWCHIVEDALRKVKVQTKLPFKALTPAQLEKQKQAKAEEKQEQEQSSDKENYVPLDLSKKQKPGSKKRPFSAMAGKKIPEEVVAEPRRRISGGFPTSSSSSSSSSSPSSAAAAAAAAAALVAAAAAETTQMSLATLAVTKATLRPRTPIKYSSKI
ncbi:DHS-like NAD/FAD-binding domain-containing protein, partial [Dissophora ornata]